jgi:hypothetical protein
MIHYPIHKGFRSVLVRPKTLTTKHDPSYIKDLDGSKLLPVHPSPIKGYAGSPDPWVGGNIMRYRGGAQT